MIAKIYVSGVQRADALFIKPAFGFEPEPKHDGIVACALTGRNEDWTFFESLRSGTKEEKDRA